MDTFAAKLRRALAKADMTQAALARRANLDESSVSRYVRGTCEPTLGQFCAIVVALGIEPRELLPLGGSEATSDPATPACSRPRERASARPREIPRG